MNYILQAPRPMGFSRQEYWSGLPCPPLGDLSNPGIEPSSSTLQVNSLLSELPGKPKNTGVGSLSPLWGNLPTLESNQGLLHCRWILYQLSYPGSTHWVSKKGKNGNKHFLSHRQSMTDSVLRHRLTVAYKMTMDTLPLKRGHGLSAFPSAPARSLLAVGGLVFSTLVY